MTNEELTTLCILWQQRLRLQDWNIWIGFFRHYEMQPETFGNTAAHTKHNQAYIKILSEQDVSENCVPPYDPEKTVVHELLHLHLRDIEKEPGSREEETAIEAIASALVKAYRKCESLKKSKSEPSPTGSSKPAKKNSKTPSRTPTTTRSQSESGSGFVPPKYVSCCYTKSCT